jgi:hypothetical protein
MKKIVLGLLMSFVSCSGYALEMEMGFPQPSSNGFKILKKHSSDSSSHRGKRGLKGPRGHRGPKGKKGDPGRSASSIADRAYLLAPDVANPIIFNAVNMPMVVPVNHTDLGSVFFDASLNGFVVPESGVYQISYCVKATRFEANGSGGGNLPADASGLVMGIAIDENLDSLIGMRSLPLISSLVPDTDVVFGTHEIFVTLQENQTIRLVIQAIPENTDLTGVSLQFVQTGAVVGEAAHVSIQKVGP